nr:PCRF domain-containing protein [Actinomycetota bacterium]
MEIEERVAGLENEYARVVDELADPSVYSDQKRFKELSRRHKELEAIVSTNRELKAVAADLQAAAELAELADLDEVESIQAEIDTLRQRQAQLEEQMELALLPRD